MRALARLALGTGVLLYCGMGGSLMAAETNTLTAEEIADGWLLLFDGESLFGWQPTSKADWQVHEGLIAVGQGEPGLLATTSQFADYQLRVDFRCPKGTNSGLFLRTTKEPRDPTTDCYELNIADPLVSPFPTGSFVKRQKAEGDGAVDTSQWRTFDVTAQGGHFVVRLDGQLVLDYTDPHPLKRGVIGLQFNSGKAEFRNVKLKPLGLESLLKEALTGWNIFPEKQSQFSVSEAGILQVRGGPGQLETKHSFGDFILQTQVYVAGKQLNSGIFFRNIPGEFAQGYECQIQNGFRQDDRDQPVDCGTGGFYRRQNARRVVSDDFQWFTLTLAVSGDHMAAWVEGYPVSDWTDPRPPHDNPRKGRRTQAGTLALQGHDPTTDLSFRKMRAAELPPR